MAAFCRMHMLHCVLVRYFSDVPLVVCLCEFVRMIQQAFIDMENMFDLMKEEQEVSDVFIGGVAVGSVCLYSVMVYLVLHKFSQRWMII